MAAPERVSLTVYKGSRFQYQINVTQDEVAVDLSGYTAHMQVRASVDSDTVLYEATTDDDLTIDTSAVILDIAGATSTAWDWTSGVYDLEIVSPTLDTYRIIEGRIKVKPEVTR